MTNDIEKEIDYWVQYNGQRLGEESPSTRDHYRRYIEMRRARQAELEKAPIPVLTIPFKF